MASHPNTDIVCRTKVCVMREQRFDSQALPFLGGNQKCSAAGLRTQALKCGTVSVQ